MPRTISLGALALLLSGSSVAVPVLAESGHSPSSTLLAMARSSEPVLESVPDDRPPTPVAIREQQPPDAPSEPSALPTAPLAPQPIAPAPAQRRVVQVTSGEASWYGPGFFGNRTANGEVFRPGTLTAAHRTLPFGTKVRVTNLWNGRTAVVRINDRGPFHGARVIDLAHGAAQKLGLTASGIAQVKLEVLQ